MGLRFEGLELEVMRACRQVWRGCALTSSHVWNRAIQEQSRLVGRCLRCLNDRGRDALEGKGGDRHEHTVL